MRKTDKYDPHNFLWFIAVFFLMSITAYAQEDSAKSPYPQLPQSTSFDDQAKELSGYLGDQTGLSFVQAGKVTQILIDYRKDITDARNKEVQRKRSTGETTDETGGQAKVNTSGLLGDNIEQYYKGASWNLMSDYKDADQTADGRIRGVFDNETQREQYNQIKGKWWKDVKDRVFASLNEKSQPVNVTR